MPATNGITDPDDPRIAARNEILDRLDAGQRTLAAAAAEMGVSTTWARKLRNDRRQGGVDPARLRKDMLDPSRQRARQAIYARRQDHRRAHVREDQGQPPVRRFARRGHAALLAEGR